MASIYNTVKSCIIKTAPPEDKAEVAEAGGDAKVDGEKPTGEISDSDVDNVKENDAPELISDKKTDEQMEPPPKHSLAWRMGSGVWGVATGTVGLGVGSVKWVAGKGYDAGHAVVSTGVSTAVAVKNKMPEIRKHPKKD